MIKNRWNTILSRTNQATIMPEDPEQRIYQLVTESKQFGVISQTNKLKIANLIRKNKGIPSELRKELWLLSSGAKRAKSNNPGYYSATEERKSHNFSFNLCSSSKSSSSEFINPLLS